MKTTRSCGKVRYRSRLDALMALASCRWRDSPTRPKTEQRAYFHRLCKGWHLTSMARGDAS